MLHVYYMIEEDSSTILSKLYVDGDRVDHPAAYALDRKDKKYPNAIVAVQVMEG